MPSCPCTGPVGAWICAATAWMLLAVPIRAQSPASPPPLTFEQALDLAAISNLDLAAARRERAIREGALGTAGLAPNPDVVFETSRDAPHQTLSLEVPLEMGQRGRRLRLAREELTLADVAVQAELARVRAEVRRRFYALVAADRRLQIAGDLVTIATRFRDAAQARFDAGAAPALDVMQADLGVTRAETDRDLADSERMAAQAALNSVLDRAPGRPIAARGEMSDRTDAPPFDEALRRAREANADLTRLDRELAVEQRRVDLLRVERRPTPIFSVGGVFNAPGEFDAGPRVGVSIGLPLFSRNQGEIAASAATSARLRAERDAAERRVENDVFAAIARIDAQRRRIAAYEERLVPTASELESLTEESYQAGRSPLVGVLDAQRSLRDLRLESLQAALELQLALADLEEVLGTPIG